MTAAIDEAELLVTQVRREAAGVVSVTLEDPDGGPLAPWAPGAHLELVLPSGLVRQYSLCGRPSDAARYTVAVLREPSGRGGSAEVHDCGLVGRRLLVRGPRNRFPLADAERYLFIAGGIGITPILAMARSVAQSRTAPWALHYGGRSRRSMAFTRELGCLAGLGRPGVGRSGGGAGGGSVDIVAEDERGMLDLAAILAPADAGTQVYACGPAGLLAAVQEHCAALGLPAPHVERFTAEAAPAGPEPAEDRAFEVELARTGARVTVTPGETLLAAVRRVVPDVLSSCEEGFCGTCETRVLAGTPDHRDTILTDAEREKGDTMFLCVSRARTPSLTIDL